MFCKNYLTILVYKLNLAMKIERKIREVSSETTLVKQQITTKLNIINKAMSVKEYHVCDARQTEIRQLMKQKDKVKLEKQLAELKKKEAKSKWRYQRIGKKDSTATSFHFNVLLSHKDKIHAKC